MTFKHLIGNEQFFDDLVMLHDFLIEEIQSVNEQFFDDLVMSLGFLIEGIQRETARLICFRCSIEGRNLKLMNLAEMKSSHLPTCSAVENLS